MLSSLSPFLPPPPPLLQKKMAMRKELAETTYPKWFGLLSKKMVGGREGGRERASDGGYGGLLVPREEHLYHTYCRPARQ